MKVLGAGACVSASSAPYQRTDDAPFNPHFHEAIPLEPCSPQVLIPYLLIPFSPWRSGILAEQAAFEAPRAGGPLDCVYAMPVSLRLMSDLLWPIPREPLYNAAGVISLVPH